MNTAISFSSFAIADSIQAMRMESFEYRHQKAVDAVANKISIAAGEIAMEWRNIRRQTERKGGKG